MTSDHHDRPTNTQPKKTHNEEITDEDDEGREGQTDGETKDRLTARAESASGPVQAPSCC